MYFRKDEVDKKVDKLEKLSNIDLLDRIRSFPNQDLLNKDTNGNKRKFQVGLAASQYEQNSLDDRSRQRLIKTFASITTIAVGTQDIPNIPANAFGYDVWNFDIGKVDGKKISFGLTDEADGQIAVHAPITDFTTAKVGYLNEQFVNSYPVHGDRMITGQWYRGQLELVFDVEQLYEESARTASLTTDGRHVYEQSFTIANIKFELQKWDDHEADPDALKRFEDTMNAFPMRELIGDVLDKNGLDNPITDITWDLGTADRYFKLRITTDQHLNGSQLLCVDRALTYLTSESAYKRNEDAHLFGNYLTNDSDFLAAVSNAFETNMQPSKRDLFNLKGSLTEVSMNTNLFLTDADLMGLDDNGQMSV